MSDPVDALQHERLRGVILEFLIIRSLDWVPFTELHYQIVTGQGYQVTADGLRYELRYLVDKELVELKILRAKRAGIELMAVRAKAKAVDLFEGSSGEDVGVSFLR